MKKALTITLTLILGFGANAFIGIGLMVLGMLMYDIEPLAYVTIAAAISAYTALLSFIAWKLSKIINGAVIILCAQLPAIILWAASHIATFSGGAGFGNASGFLISLVTMVAALIISALTYNKNKLGKWLNENF